MDINTLFEGIGVTEWVGEKPTSVAGVTNDSRKAAKGWLFVAVRGANIDGHNFIGQAVDGGVSVVVCEEVPAERRQGVAFAVVKDSSAAFGQLASNWYGRPSEKLKLVGITGTNGKTTTVTLLHRMATQLGYKAGLLSTVRNIVGTKAVEATQTTPDPLQLHRLLAEMVEIGCDYCFMEVSSHAAHQRRIAGLKFAGAIFSNLTQDHLDYHKTFADYRDAKKMFFDGLSADAFALVNTDDRNGMFMLQNCAASKHTYALKSVADFKCKILESGFEGMQLNIDGVDVWTTFVGKFNAYNLLAVYSASILLGFDKTEVLTVLSTLGAVDGRFQCLRSKSGKTAIVDYAHTPDAIENVLNTIKEITDGNHQIITVTGAGGNRDKTKRPLMAAIAVELSDKLILTSDNPRNEKPEDIIADMKAGVPAEMAKKTLAVTDRTEAIRTACMLAQPGDVVLVAGKGHETYQEVNGVKHHFDDREVIKQIFDEE
ncbi:MAG: UDP-N-acetylmuramoyl-L-alanyl-D-glutamate--2,6-diaminopimelate ligase [Salinivirgaceae bacterium]|nr:UDP-N-acetylmuramoyl-L-alanyl-D-glutamate--2,6-diaminopimelate ligase [Salinivirgaceae bacterium]